LMVGQEVWGLHRPLHLTERWALPESGPGGERAVGDLIPQAAWAP
jgi:hypothetical protein